MSQSRARWAKRHHKHVWNIKSLGDGRLVTVCETCGETGKADLVDGQVTNP